MVDRVHSNGQTIFDLTKTPAPPALHVLDLDRRQDVTGSAPSAEPVNRPLLRQRHSWDANVYLQHAGMGLWRQDGVVSEVQALPFSLARAKGQAGWPIDAIVRLGQPRHTT